MVRKQTDIETRLRQALAESPLSLNQLSAHCGIDVGILSRFLRAERTMTLPTAARLAKVLGLELRATKRQKRRK